MSDPQSSANYPDPSCPKCGGSKPTCCSCPDNDTRTTHNTPNSKQEAPERFWIAPQKNGKFTDTFRVSQYSAFDGATEYIRADLARVRASVAAVEGSRQRQVSDLLDALETDIRLLAEPQPNTTATRLMVGKNYAMGHLAVLRSLLAAVSSPAPAEPPPCDLPFDDYCAGKDCRNCKGVNCTCQCHAPLRKDDGSECTFGWQCSRPRNGISAYCVEHDKTPAEPLQPTGEQE